MKLPLKITTERLELKAITRPSFKLAQEIYALIEGSREIFDKWLILLRDVRSPEDEFSFLQNCRTNWKQGTEFHFLITDKKTKKLFGIVGFCRVSQENKSAEIGYWLSNDAVGHGYVQESIHALEDNAFSVGFNRLFIRNDTLNKRSAETARRSGYVLDGVMREDIWDAYNNRWRSTNFWSKLKSDWKKTKSKKAPK